jgi:hypothetical protein
MSSTGADPFPVLTEITTAYADTSAAALHWSTTLPDVTPLETLRLPSSDGGIVRLELRLLGASHCTVLDVVGEQLVETVASPAYGGGGDVLPERRQRTVGALWYRFASHIERLDPGGLSALAAQLRAGVRSRPDRLAGVFPGTSDALTVLHGATAPSLARWSTWHLYPNTGEVVRTVTTVDW